MFLVAFEEGEGFDRLLRSSVDAQFRIDRVIIF